MSGHYVFVEDGADVRQGDIICRRAEKDVRFGFILTADCDIAQRKNNDRFTWLEIIPAHKYLEFHWATDQLRRILDRHGKIACEGINAIIKRSENQFSELTPSSLSAWLDTSSPEEILSAVSQGTAKADTKLLNVLRAVRIAKPHNDGAICLRRLREAWSLLGRDRKSQQSAMREAFDSERGFPDHVLVPDLPSVTGYGFVILLRHIESLSGTELFRSEADARINGQPQSFYRIGRFSDSLRHSVAQKLAFLFSRIGMTTDYEDSCSLATELAIDMACSCHGD